MDEPAIIQNSAQKMRQWLDELARELGSDDRNYAYRVMRAHLHAIRDRISVEESAQLAAQLPILVRGVYYDGWVPAHVPGSYRTVDEFLGRIEKEARLAGETESSVACQAATAVLRRHVSAGELDDVIAGLPEPLRPLLAG
jgi:uncharacterized protein (DUF2267 family)